jgi:hypothetical protein
VANVRVWAEEREGTEFLLTWEWQGDDGERRDHASDMRTAAAVIGVLEGVVTASPDDSGVSVVYDPEITTKQEIASALRSALSIDDDLKTRSNDMLKRLPKYATLAASIALDDRMSPVPEVARQTALRQAAAPTRMVPGLSLLTRIHTIIPMMRSLSSWSRTASPEDVELHFQKVGLSREQLDRDLATSQEVIAHARAQASSTTAAVTARATEAASQARSLTREWLRKQQEKRDQRDQ